MSLTLKEQLNTKQELRENFEKSALTLQQVATDLATTPDYIEQLLDLNTQNFNHTWILRNYLYNHIKKHDGIPTEFTALKGNARDYWFLDSEFIEGGKILFP